MSALSAITPTMTANRPLLAPDARLAADARRGDPRGLALEAARTLVSEGLVKPIFAELREGNMAADMFKPGVAEKRFRPLLDGMLADRVVASNDFPVVGVIADRFERALSRRSASDPVPPYTARGTKP
ncbi:MAG: hypothetical protein RLY21_1130 [Planctomycetota bacterium]|jgi:hypothetical protein